MAGPSASRASRRLTYSGTYLASLRRRTRGAMPWVLSREPFALAAVLSLGLLNGGCAVSGMFGIGKDDALARAETTGSIPPGAKLSTGLPSARCSARAARISARRGKILRPVRAAL